MRLVPNKKDALRCERVFIKPWMISGGWLRTSATGQHGSKKLFHSFPRRQVITMHQELVPEACGSLQIHWIHAYLMEWPKTFPSFGDSSGQNASRTNLSLMTTQMVPSPTLTWNLLEDFCIWRQQRNALMYVSVPYCPERTIWPHSSGNVRVQLQQRRFQLIYSGS